MATNIKNVEVNVRFTTGTSVTNLVPVDKSKYASLQSKACTYKNTLIAGISTGKLTRDEAVKNWNDKVVRPWVEMVENTARESYPEEVQDFIEGVEPNSGMLELGELPAEKSSAVAVAESAE